MIKFYYPDGTLTARAEKADRTDMYEFEITGFELVEAGVMCR